MDLHFSSVESAQGAYNAAKVNYPAEYAVPFRLSNIIELSIIEDSAELFKLA
jgi:hypothetical protein